MTTIKSGQISLYCHFNKIIKGSGTSFQSPVSTQKHIIVCHTTHQYLTKVHFDWAQDSKEIAEVLLPLSNYVYDDVTGFAICGFHKTTKFRYIENETLFLLQIKKIINCILRATFWQNIVLQQRQPLRCLFLLLQQA